MQETTRWARNGKYQGKVTINKPVTILPKRATNTTASRNQTKKIKKVILNMAERKFVGQLVPYASMNPTGNIFPLSDVEQGVSDSQRDGDTIHITSIEFRYSLILRNLTTIAACACRIIIFQWKQNTGDTGTVPFPEQILQHLPVSNTTDPTLPYNVDNRQNYSILFDRMFTLEQNARPGYVGRKIITKGFRNDVQFNGVDLTGTNKIFLLTVADTGVGDENSPMLKFMSKVNYRDF